MVGKWKSGRIDCIPFTCYKELVVVMIAKQDNSECDEAQRKFPREARRNGMNAKKRNVSEKLGKL